MDQSVTIKIAGQEYSLKASSPQMERLMRLAAESVNKKLEGFSAKYPDRTLADKLAFVVLNEAVSRLALQKSLEDVKAEVSAITVQLDSYLDTIEEK